MIRTGPWPDSQTKNMHSIFTKQIYFSSPFWFDNLCNETIPPPVKFAGFLLLKFIRLSGHVSMYDVKSFYEQPKSMINEIHCAIFYGMKEGLANTLKLNNQIINF